MHPAALPLAFGGLMAALSLTLVALSLAVPLLSPWTLPLPMLLVGYRHGLRTGLTASAAGALVALLLFGWGRALAIYLPLFAGGAAVGAALRRGWSAEAAGTLYGAVTLLLAPAWGLAFAWTVSGGHLPAALDLRAAALQGAGALYAAAGERGGWAVRLLDHAWVLVAGNLLATGCLLYNGLSWTLNRLPVHLPVPGSYRELRRPLAWWAVLLTGLAAAALCPRGSPAYPLAALLPWAAVYPLALHGLGAFERHPPPRYRRIVASPWWPYAAFPALLALPLIFLPDALAEAIRYGGVPVHAPAPDPHAAADPRRRR